MKILEQEIALREETRALDQARDALNADRYDERARPLADTQAELGVRVLDVIQQLRDLEAEENKAYPKEIALLTRVEQVMQEAHELLDRPETGPETIAAETEVIELLLQAKRANPKSGGGGGGDTPGGGGQGDTEEAALALVGSGSESSAHAEERNVGQATGVSGSELPAEFRAGLDAYFGGLEASRGAGGE